MLQTPSLCSGVWLSVEDRHCDDRLSAIPHGCVVQTAWHVVPTCPSVAAAWMNPCVTPYLLLVSLEVFNVLFLGQK